MDSLEKLLCSEINSYILKNYAEYPSSEYLRKGLVDIKFNESNLKSIKIYHTQNRFLMIRGIKLIMNGEELQYNSIPEYKVTNGIQHGKRDPNFKFNDIVNPFMIKTPSRKEQALLQIEFDMPVTLDEIIIYTGKEEYGLRDIYLNIDIITDDGALVPIYNYQDQIESYVKKISEEIDIAQATRGQIYIVTQILLYMNNDSFRDILIQLKSAEKEGLNSSILKDCLNEMLLPRKRKITFGHGYVYTFDFWSEKEKIDYLTKANAVIDILRKEISPTIFYAYGTILGFIREKDYFIPHDYDLDVMLVVRKSQYKTYDEVSAAVQKVLTSHGVTVLKDVKRNGGLFVTYQKSKRFDIYMCIEEDGLVKRKGIYYKYEDLDPVIYIDILGVPCPLPRNPFSFLDRAFGKDWRIPKDIKTRDLRENILRKTAPENFDKEYAINNLSS